MIGPEIDQQTSSLKLVRNELDESLDKARSDLEVYAEGDDAGDIEALKNCRLGLRQIHDTLIMVQLEGALVLVSEMNSLLDALIDSASDDVIEHEVAFEVLMRGMLRLSGYFARIQSGQADAAMVFLPLVNELRSVHGLDALLPESLFTPRLMGIRPAPGTRPPQDLRTLIKDTRHQVHLGILGLLHSKDTNQSLQPVISLFEQYYRAADSELAQQTYWIGAAVAEAICEGGLEEHIETARKIFSQIDRKISRAIIDSGEENLVVDASDNLIRMLLYYVATSSSEGVRVSDIRMVFRLSEYLPQDGNPQHMREGLAGRGLNVIETVTDGIIQELEQARDMLDVYYRTGEQDNDKLRDMVQALSNAIGAIAMLGHADLQEMMVHYCRKVEKLIDGDNDSGTAELAGLPDLIFQVESRLQAMLPKGHETTETGLTGSSTGVSDATVAVIKESSINMSNAKDAIAAYAEHPDAERGRLDLVNELLQQIAGSLKIVSHLRASEIIYGIRSYIDGELISAGKSLNDEEISNLADAVSSADYYLDAVLNDLPYRQEALNLAEKSLVSLGHEIQTGHTIEIDQGGVESGSITEAVNELAALDAAGGDDSMLDSLSDDLEFELASITADSELELDEITQGLDKVGADESTDSGGFVIDDDLDDVDIDGEALRNIGLDGEGEREVDEQIVDVEEIEVVPPEEPEEVMMERVQASLDSDGRPKVDGEIQVEDIGAPLEEIEVTAETVVNNQQTEGGQGGWDVQTGSLLGDDLDEEIIGIFIEEAEEVLDELKRCYPAWESDVQDQEALAVIRRSFHTLKGSGRMVGAMQIGQFSWSLENLLNHVIDNTIPADKEVVQVVGESIDILPEMIACLKGDSVADTRYEVISSDAARLAAGKSRMVAVSQEQQTASSPAGEVAEPTSPKLLNEVSPDQIDESISGGLLQSDELRLIYTNETTAYLQTLFEFIAQCKPNAGECLFKDEHIRILHTLHGGLATVGAYDIKEIFEALESLVVFLHGHGQAADDQLIELLQRSLEQVRQFLDSINDGEGPFSPDESLVDELSSKYREYLDLYDPCSIDGYQAVLQRQDQSALEEISSSLEDLHSFMETDTPVEIETSPPVEMIASDDLNRAELQSLEADPTMEPDPEVETMEDGGSAEQEESAEEEIEEAIDPEILEIFIEEAAELLAATETALNDWQEEPGNMEHVMRLQRHIHTFKGGARMVDFSGIGDLGHELETLLASIVEGQTEVTDQIFNVLFDVRDELQAMYEAARESGQNILPQESSLKVLEALREGSFERPIEQPLPADVEEDAVASIDAPSLTTDDHQSVHTNKVESPGSDAHDIVPLSIADEAPAGDMSSTMPEQLSSTATESHGDTPLASIVAAAEKQADKKIDSDKDHRDQPHAIHESIRVRSELVDNLVNLAGESNIFRSRLEQQSSTFRFSLGELDQTVARLKNQLRQMEIETEAQILFRHERDGGFSGMDDSFDPLEMDRYSQLQQLSKNLMESVGDLGSLQDILGGLSQDAELLLIQQGRVNAELQDRLMQARVVPFAATMASRLRRIIRQTCQELGKKAILKLVGANEEMDRRLLDRMTPPLEHMIRNSIAHGIESPEIRSARNKPEAGEITVSVSREGGEIVIQVADDGGGLDTASIRKKAEDKGFIVKNADMTDDDIMQLILNSGFSTVDEISQVAGRGVGMDVVNNEIRQLGGVLKIESLFERGTTMTIRLPFTLVISQALLIGIASDLYAIPLGSVEGVARMTYEQAEEIMSHESATYQYGGEDYQVASLGKVLGRPVATHEEDSKPAIILVKASGHRIAFYIDEITGRREIVVKPLGAQVGSINGIAGGTILGDGRVALILDVPALVRMVAAVHGLPEVHKEQPVESSQGINARIMIVDDSITVRHVTTRLLERHDMEVVTAKDGFEAIALLEKTIPDVMLLDIEMPRMDGYELATHMKNDKRYKSIPILMITSRAGEKHRERAEAIGVEHYLGKPYQEVDLLMQVNKMLAEKRDYH